MKAPKVWQRAEAPPSERCLKLVLRPHGWKARLWRAFDGSVMPMMRLDIQLALHEVENLTLRDLLTPFAASLRNLPLYLERGASVALPVAWSVGRLSIERDSSSGFLHHVLDDPFGRVLATLFRTGDTRADVTLSLSPYEIGRDRLVFAMRDYDIGTGADFGR